ncbi:MAG: hypothetical protein IIY15_06040, partial [Flavobacteriales bacterium]|nr:hypothetical protein [Flavobacteriales bacterium]
MKKVKKYLWAMVVMTGMLFSCGEPVVMDRPSSAFLSLEKNFDYQAKTNQKMGAVKKWYEKHTENGKEEINIKVQGLAGGDYFIKYPTPIVKSPDLLSINDATVAGSEEGNRVLQGQGSFRRCGPDAERCQGCGFCEGSDCCGSRCRCRQAA